MILDTYARAMADTGRNGEAIDYEKKALAACEENSLKAGMEAALKKYQAAAGKAKSARVSESWASLWPGA